MFLLRGLLALVAGFTVVPFAFSAPPSAVDELKAVVVLFRHGDRSPLSSWPNDIYYGNSTLWPDGYGQLNNLGKERHYRLGQWFRERYDGFLPKRYNHNDIYIQSTDVDRTLMSAASNLAGLYPPLDDQVWNSAVNWQPIPIHTTDAPDPIIASTVACKRHSTLLTELKNSEEFQQINSDLQDFFKNISEATGASSLNIASFDEIHTSIRIYREFNLSLPEWTDIYWDKIFELAALDFHLNTYTTELARLRTGPFFDYLLNHFNSIINNVLSEQKHVKGPRHQNVELAASGSQKFLMLSAHDTNVADRLGAMGVYDDAAPDFSSVVIWELKNGQNGTYVNTYFKNETHFTEFIIPGCEIFNCSYEDYVNALEPVTVSLDQWTKECEQ